MSNPNASTPENFFFVEVSAVVAKLLKDRNDEMQAGKNGDRDTYDRLNYSGKGAPVTVIQLSSISIPLKQRVWFDVFEIWRQAPLVGIGISSG